MESWYSIGLGDGITAAMPSAEIERSFLPLFNAAGKPADMAVFTRLESEGCLHCEVIAYFSPTAQDVAKAFDADLAKSLPQQVWSCSQGIHIAGLSFFLKALE